MDLTSFTKNLRARRNWRIRKWRLGYREHGQSDKTEFLPLVQNRHTAEQNLSANEGAGVSPTHLIRPIVPSLAVRARRLKMQSIAACDHAKRFEAVDDRARANRASGFGANERGWANGWNRSEDETALGPSPSGNDD